VKKSWLTLIVTILGGLATAFEPNVQEVVTKNPEWAGVAIAVLGIINNLLRPTMGPNKSPETK